MAANFLIVDDDDAIHDIAEIFLEADGRTFFHAESLTEGLELAARESFEVLLLDNSLPDGLGSMSIGTFKELQPCLQVLMMSAQPTLESAIAAVKGGAFDYLEKPFKPELLEHKVERALERAATEHRRQETQHRLMQSEERYAQTFEATLDALLLFDPVSGMIRDANHAACMTYESTVQGLTQRSFFDLIEDPGASTGAERVRQLHRRPKSGAIFPAEVSIRDVAADGLRLATVRDISEIEKAERERLELERAMAAMSKMEAIGQMAGGIAHDFNNLLFVVLSSAEYLQHLMDEWDGSAESIEDMQDALVDILTCGSRGAALTKQLLAYARRDEIGRGSVDLDEVVVATKRILARAIGAHIEFQVEVGGSGTVFADTDQLTQIVMNLSVNARDAMPDGGELKLTTSKLVVPSEGAPEGLEPGRYARLDVRDTGTGMPPEVVDRIFEPFYTTKEVNKGTGLGLYTVHGIITQSGGTITVDTAPGKGTCFSVFLPQADIQRQPTPTRLATVRPLRRRLRILVAEDEDSIRRIVRRMLERNGYEVLAAPNGAIALEMLSGDAADVDLVITDVVMPRMGGRDLARTLTETRPGTPVIFMSGYAQDVGLDSTELVNFLPKPFTPNDLNRAIARVMADVPLAPA